MPVLCQPTRAFERRKALCCQGGVDPTGDAAVLGVVSSYS